MTAFGVQLHGTFPMGAYPELARRVESIERIEELTVHDVVWQRPVWPILTLVARATSRVRIGPDVTHPFLVHPAVTAANLAALDELSAGRAVFGVGRGSFLGDLEVEMRDSVGAVREMVELVGHLLRGTRAPFLGRHFRATARAGLFWSPPRGRIPVFVGAFGPAMIAESATWADEIRPPGTWRPDFLLDVRRRVAAVGGKAEVGGDVWLSLDRDRARARALGRQVLAQFLPQMRALTDFHRVDPAEVAAVAERLRDQDLTGAAAAISDRTLDTFVAAGDPDDVAAGLDRLLEASPATLVFSGRLGPEPLAALDLLQHQVLAQI